MADTELPVGATMNDNEVVVGGDTPKQASPNQGPDSPKQASVKAASPKQASVKAASPKAASPKAASPKADETQTLSPKADAEKAGSPKHASPRAASKADSPQAMNDEPEVVAEPEPAPQPEPEYIEKETDEREIVATGNRRGAKNLKENVVWNPSDSTIDTILSQNGCMVSSFMGNGFQHLYSGTRASHGVTKGRVVFEVRVADIIHVKKENEKYASRIASPLPRSNLRVGFGTNDSSLIVGNDEDSIAFTDEGFWIHKKTVTYGGRKDDKNKVKVTRTRPGDTLAFILNRDPDSELFNTISVFKNGERFTDPKPIPENMVDKSLFPMVALRNAVIYTNFGNLGFGSEGHANLLCSLPFTVRLMQQMPPESIVSSVVPLDGKPMGKGGKYELLIPIGVPDEGTFDVVDQFLAKGNNRHLYVEISDRALMEWCEASLPSCRGHDWKNSTDRPTFMTGSPCLDDGWVKDCIRGMLPMIKRNVIIMEVCHNLLPTGRAEVLKNFPSSRFTRKALVSIGEPPQEFKDKQRELAIADWKAANPQKAPQAKVEAQPEVKADEASPIQGSNDEETPLENKEVNKEENSTEAKEEEKEPEPEPKMDEKHGWFRVRSVPDICQQTFFDNVEKFSLPGDEEGFDQVIYEWSKTDACMARLEKLVYECKMSSKPPWITEPGEGFKPTMQQWMSSKLEWRKKQREYTEGKTKKEAEAKGEEDTEEIESGEQPEEIDIDSVFDIDNIDGKGQPLYVNFKAEDWALTNLRYELFLINKQWKLDVTSKDPIRVGIIPKLLPWAYSLYFKRTLDPRTFGPHRSKIEEVLQLVEDTVKVCEDGYLVSILSEDAEPAEFLKLTEKARREREAKIAAGDESAKVEYKQASQPQPQGAKGKGHIGKGYGKGPSNNGKGWSSYSSPNYYPGAKGYPGKGMYTGGQKGGKGYGSLGPGPYSGYKRPMDGQGGYPYATQRPRW